MQTCDRCGQRHPSVREVTLARFRSPAGYWQSDVATLCLACARIIRNQTVRPA